MTVRKNQVRLTADERARFVASSGPALKRDGRYGAFVTTHNAFPVGDTDDGERTGQFTVQHRPHDPSPTSAESA
jgi:tyrosinase